MAKSEYEAKFSLQHTVAAALLLPLVDFSAFSEAGRARAAKLALRVNPTGAEPYLSAYPVSWGSKVSILMKNGSELVAARTHAKGDPEAPLSMKIWSLKRICC